MQAVEGALDRKYRRNPGFRVESGLEVNLGECSVWGVKYCRGWDLGGL